MLKLIITFLTLTLIAACLYAEQMWMAVALLVIFVMWLMYLTRARTQPTQPTQPMKKEKNSKNQQDPSVDASNADNAGDSSKTNVIAGPVENYQNNVVNEDNLLTTPTCIPGAQDIQGALTDLPGYDW